MINALANIKSIPNCTSLQTCFLLLAIVILSGNFTQHFEYPDFNPIELTENSFESTETENEESEVNDYLIFFPLCFRYPGRLRLAEGDFNDLDNIHFDIFTPPPELY